MRWTAQERRKRKRELFCRNERFPRTTRWILIFLEETIWTRENDTSKYAINYRLKRLGRRGSLQQPPSYLSNLHLFLRWNSKRKKIQEFLLWLVRFGLFVLFMSRRRWCPVAGAFFLILFNFFILTTMAAKLNVDNTNNMTSKIR